MDEPETKEPSDRTQVDAAHLNLSLAWAALDAARDNNRGNAAGRYLSLAITDLESVLHWLYDAKRALP